ncbi:tetratricopeptide repeat protein [Pseudobacteriovorax antillogorgiicola]|uniref:Uncharacterized protein n=1 Tax=Pseudobacteriovorax antillogorgiicola TaxID=1513793 RepID=A0A1Y6CAM4_9BACT|nr:hypothetical protein [Pseudobacteriovorax antillogorgiicola]TCS48718.1 hypothetical protein EDD56_117140 [Pseudobacteriovorax antillogorgiicola]SMF54569.1 hypothetical protein SAMN06296036_11719 [Pseudobacteriovorax antillogorgiicola]
MSILKKVLMALMMACLAVPTFAQDQEGVDYLSLAGRLMRDGDYQRAEEILKKVPPNEVETEKYKTIRGLLWLYQEDYDAALESFDHIIEGGTEDRYVYIYKGQALYGLKMYEKALKVFARVDDLSASIPSIYLIRGRAHWSLNQKPQAWQMMARGEERFQDDFRFMRLRLTWMIEEGLLEQAYQLGAQIIGKNLFAMDDQMAIAAGLRNAGAHEQAIKLLEILRLRYPSSPNVLIQLAYSYMKRDKLLTAAQMFEKASYFNEKYIFEAAELYRRAGTYGLAMSLNHKIKDQKQKFRQRLAILIAMGDYESATFTEPELDRLGLLQQEELRYALAYAYFKTGALDKVEEHLARITEPGLFKKAVALRKEIANCQSSLNCV